MTDKGDRRAEDVFDLRDVTMLANLIRKGIFVKVAKMKVVLGILARSTGGAAAMDRNALGRDASRREQGSQGQKSCRGIAARVCNYLGLLGSLAHDFREAIVTVKRRGLGRVIVGWIAVEAKGV